MIGKILIGWVAASFIISPIISICMGRLAPEEERALDDKAQEEYLKNFRRGDREAKEPAWKAGKA